MPVPRYALELFLASLLLVSWSAAASGNCAAQVGTVQIDPLDHNVIYAGTIYDGLFRSMDSGRTWAPLLEPRVESVPALIFDPTAPSSIYGATYGEYLFRSIDSGKSWQRSTRGLAQLCGSVPCINSPDFFALAADPGGPSTIYAVAGALFRSQDSGANWSRIPFAPIDQQWSAWTILVEPAPTSRIYVAADTETQNAIFKSTDHGVTWSATQNAPPTQTFSLVADPSDPSILFAGTTEGIYESTDGGEHWRATKSDVPNQFLYLFDVRQIVADEKVPGTFYAAADVLKVFKSTDHGETWLSTNQGLEDQRVEAIAIDPTDSSIVFAGTWSGVYRSANGGATWQRSFDFGAVPAILGTDPETLHVGQTSYENSDGSSGYLVTVIGTGFVSGSTIYWNGFPRQTRSYSPSSCTRLVASIPSADFAAPGLESIEVANPDGSRSEPFLMQIQPRLPTMRIPIPVFGSSHSRHGRVDLPRP